MWKTIDNMCYTVYPLPFHLNTDDTRLIQANAGESVKMCYPCLQLIIESQKDDKHPEDHQVQL